MNESITDTLAIIGIVVLLFLWFRFDKVFFEPRVDEHLSKGTYETEEDVTNKYGYNVAAFSIWLYWAYFLISSGVTFAFILMDKPLWLILVGVAFIYVNLRNAIASWVAYTSTKGETRVDNDT